MKIFMYAVTLVHVANATFMVILFTFSFISLSLSLSLSLSPLPLSLVDDTKRLVSSAGGTQEQLAEAATKAVITIQTGADQVKKGASSLTSDDVEAQVSFSYISVIISLSLSLSFSMSFSLHFTS